MKTEIKNGELIITIQIMNPPMPSKSGKTLLVASSGGIVPTGTIIDGKPVQIGLNAFIARNDMKVKP